MRSGAGSWGVFLVPGFCPGKGDHELAATTFSFAGGRDGAAMQLHEPLCQGKTDTQAGVGTLQHRLLPGEYVEYATEVLLGDADTAVAHADADPLPHRRGCDLDAPALGCIGGGVIQQVGQHLRQSGGVGAKPQRLVGQADHQIVTALVHQRPRRLHRALDNTRHGHRLQAKLHHAPGNPGDFQQIVYETGEVPDGR